jgi:DNA invertase Pin-like site-specific DNA recombinase
MNAIRAAFYARVSSEQQAAAHTIESQLAALSERAKADGSALDGAQIAGDDNEVSGTRERCSRPARSGCRAQCR